MKSWLQRARRGSRRTKRLDLQTFPLSFDQLHSARCHRLPATAEYVRRGIPRSLEKVARRETRFVARSAGDARGARSDPRSAARSLVSRAHRHVHAQLQASPGHARSEATTRPVGTRDLAGGERFARFPLALSRASCVSGDKSGSRTSAPYLSVAENVLGPRDQGRGTKDVLVPGSFCRKSVRRGSEA